MTQGSKNEEVHLSQGPFMRGDDEKDKEETKLEWNPFNSMQPVIAKTCECQGQICF